MAKLGGKVVKAVRTGSRDTGQVVGESLKALRELAGITQGEMALRLKVGQASISKIEHRGDVQISSLRKYVEALGAALRVEAAFPAHGSGTNEADDDILTKAQLVFPIFADGTYPNHRDVVLSVRPQYSEKIVEGIKTVELRRRFPMTTSHGAVAYIYCTSPVQALVGRAQIAEVTKATTQDLWKRFSKKASISKSEFDDYFSGLQQGFALRFANAARFPRAIELPELRTRFGFEPPQSFLYVTPALRRALENEYADLPNRHERHYRP